MGTDRVWGFAEGFRWNVNDVGRNLGNGNAGMGMRGNRNLEPIPTHL